MIGRIDIEKTLRNSPNNECLFVSVATILNRLVDAVNVLQESMDLVQSTLVAEPKTPVENVLPGYVTTTYMTDGHTKEYYGQNGASIRTDHPLPAGYVITIREPETKGGDNDEL